MCAVWSCTVWQEPAQSEPRVRRGWASVRRDPPGVPTGSIPEVCLLWEKVTNTEWILILSLQVSLPISCTIPTLWSHVLQHFKKIIISYIQRAWAQCMCGLSSRRSSWLRCSTWLQPGCRGWHYEVSCICFLDWCKPRRPCPHIGHPLSGWLHRQHPQHRAVGMCIFSSHDEGPFPKQCSSQKNLINKR